ncbi:hypothetical protein [Haliangium sp.]|uniref:hypothetical protein n=1 Tax=Haliangium sp. TaxID=2663208 RepID=UPI003D113B1C
MSSTTPRVLAAAVVLALALPAAAAPPDIFPLEDVRPGQTGYGMTTMQGTTPERFEFEVVGISKNFLPKIDIILVKSEDPKLAVSGFWRGMSGSPLYIDGKLACAFSYGFRFNKVAIGGCTPIHYMKQEGFVTPRRLYDDERGGTRLRQRNRRVSHTGARVPVPAGAAVPAASMSDWARLAPERTVTSALDTLGAPRQPWLLRAPLPPAPARVVDEAGGLVAAAVPLSMSGFSAPAFAMAKQVFGAYPLEPMRAGGTGRPNEGPTQFQPGGAIGVQLIRGDMSAAATGTVSYVDNNRVLGFGHPLFQAGELYAPVATAEIHTVIPSALHAFILASPLREIGSLVQDRPSTIMADTRLETRMIPVDIYIETSGHDGKSQVDEFHVEVLNNRFMSGSFAAIATLSAVSHFLPDRDRATVLMNSRVHVRGYEPLAFVDYLYTEDGAGSVIGGARGLRAMVPLLNNPFEPVTIERVELKATIRYGGNFGNIESIRLPTAELAPGKRSYVEVVMSTYDGSEIVEKVPFDVPAELAGSIVEVEVSAGDAARIDAAPPEDLDQLMAALRTLLPGNVLAVTLNTAEEGVAIDGALIRDLPASALDRLKPVASTPRAQVYRPIARSVFPAGRVVNGKESTLIKIADE